VFRDNAQPVEGYRNLPLFVGGGVQSRKHKAEAEDSDEAAVSLPLDLLSTSQTFLPPKIPKSREKTPLVCENNAPYFAYQSGVKTYRVVQGCCNNWNCSRCGIQRAKKEYGRFVKGCETLSEDHELWFITITCRGKEMTLDEAENGYLKWTNNLLTTWRTFAARHSQQWFYASVTERQKRGHPHSHIITTWRPPDLVQGKRLRRENSKDESSSQVWKTALVSEYLRKTCVRSGLGEQYDVSKVRDAQAASRYVAKYLFKANNFKTVWPKGWRRVRYSQNWPKLPERETNAFVLITREDWYKLASVAVFVQPDNEYTWGECIDRLQGHDTIILQNN